MEPDRRSTGQSDALREQRVQHVLHSKRCDRPTRARRLFRQLRAAANVRRSLAVYVRRMTDATPYPPPAKARVAVIALTVAYTLSFVDRQILILLLEPMKHDLQITDFQASLLQGFAFAAIYAVAGIPFGRLGDRFSRRNIIIIGVAIWSAMTMSCGVVR